MKHAGQVPTNNVDGNRFVLLEYEEGEVGTIIVDVGSEA